MASCVSRWYIHPTPKSTRDRSFVLVTGETSTEHSLCDADIYPSEPTYLLLMTTTFARDEAKVANISLRVWLQMLL